MPFSSANTVCLVSYSEFALTLYDDGKLVGCILNHDYVMYPFMYSINYSHMYVPLCVCFKYALYYVQTRNVEHFPLCTWQSSTSALILYLLLSARCPAWTTKKYNACWWRPWSSGGSTWNWACRSSAIPHTLWLTMSCHPALCSVCQTLKGQRSLPLQKGTFYHVSLDGQMTMFCSHVFLSATYFEVVTHC